MPEGRPRDDQTPPLRILEQLATSEPIKDWSLTTLKDELINIGEKAVSHGPKNPLLRKIIRPA
jgi:hypothetical protein